MQPERYEEYYFEAGEDLDITVDSQPREGLYDTVIVTSQNDEDNVNVIGALTLALSLEQMIQLADTLHEVIIQIKDDE
jgi:PhoPQ-activated pathogenicity-related protein